MKATSKKMFICTILGVIVIIIDNFLQSFFDRSSLFVSAFHVFYYVTLTLVTLLILKEYHESKKNHDQFNLKMYIFQITCLFIIVTDSALRYFSSTDNVFVSFFHYVFYAVLILFPIITLRNYFLSKR
ncbi:MAG: hypothetical protein RR565_04925 [Erysipelothrix sp.]